MPRFFLALIIALALAVPVKAQHGPAVPTAPDSLYMSGDVFAEERYADLTLATPEFIEWRSQNLPCPGRYFEPTHIEVNAPITGYWEEFTGRARTDPDTFSYGKFSHTITRFATAPVNGKTIFVFGLSGVVRWESDEDHREHLWETGYVVVRNDTLRLRDTGKPVSPRRDCRPPLGDDIYSYTFYDVPFSFADNEVIPYAVYFQVHVDPAELPEQDLLVLPHTEPGAAWLSWYLPGPRESAEAQVAREKYLYAHYEYQVLRDGDYAWRGFKIEDTELGRIEETPTRRDPEYAQRRRFLVTGLDPAKEYSFCLRMVNVTSTSNEVCYLLPVKPVSAERERPTQVTLYPNYPNPFNPSTAIEYELFAPVRIRLEVFDAIGRSVGVLVDGMRPAGTHTARFDADGLPSGLYVYRLQAGGNTIVKTMHLIR